MRGYTTKLCLLVVTLALSYVSGVRMCRRGVSWWDRERGACVPCTRCNPADRLAVMYPCELHRDTVCQSLYQIQLFPFNELKANSTTNSDAKSSELEYEYVDYGSEVTSSDDQKQWDLQTSSMTIAACGCVVFFIVVLYFSLTHAKQWRVLKQTLQSDMQDLTAKMKLMEAGGESPSEPVVATDHHIYCNVHIGKDGMIGPSSKKGLGNVYTQEKHPS
ncbi:hypothetical protein ACJJTC_017764 [Scirpophaga incertulas]